MTRHYHALVWIDHHEAKIFHFNALEAEHVTVHSSHPDAHIHHKSNAVGSGHAAVDTQYLKRVAQAIESAGAILILGPSTAKTELVAYIGRSHAELAKRISDVQTVDHPTDGELLALARRFFRADDRMHSQVAQ